MQNNILIKNKLYINFALLVIALVMVRYLFAVATAFFIPTLNWDGVQSTETFVDPNFIKSDGPVYDTYLLMGKWDSSFYLDIAINGYEKVKFNTEKYYNWAFYPLYPLVVRVLSIATGGVSDIRHVFNVGLVVSAVCLWISLVLIDKILKHLQVADEKIISTILLILAFPASYFFNLFYTESLFLTLTLATFYFLFKDRYLYAAVALSLALVTRMTGITLIPAFIIFILVKEIGERKEQFTTALGKAIAYLPIIIAPILLFYLHLYSITGDFFASFKIQKLWGNDVTLPFSLIFNYLGIYGFTIKYEFIFSLVLFVFAFFMFFYYLYKYLQEHHGHGKDAEWLSLFVYIFSYLILISSVSSMVSIFRFISVLFALFILPTYFSNFTYKKLSFLALLIFCISFQSLFFILFLLQIPAYGF